MDTTITMTDAQKDAIDELQEFMNENNLGRISKGEAAAHAARAYLQLNRDDE